MATSFKRTCACTVIFRAPDHAAGHCRPMPLSDTPGHSQASLAQSLVGTLILTPGSLVCKRFWLCPPRVCFPSPVQVLSSNPTGLQSQIPQGSSISLMNPQVGKSVVSSRTFLQCENFFGIIVLQFVGHLLSGSLVGLIAPSSKRA